MRRKIIVTVPAFILAGCAVKPIELPQQPYKYDATKSVAYHYATAMGVTNVVDLPEGKAEQLLEQRRKTMLEAGVSSSLTGYAVSFVLAKSLGLSSSIANDLALDSAEDNFVLGAGTNAKKTIRDYDNLAFYLPYEAASLPEDARRHVFEQFVQVMQNMDMDLLEIESEYEYGTGHAFKHPLCTKLDTECRYIIRIPQPVVAYAPEKLGGYKAWVWSPASRNAPGYRIYNVAAWGELATFDMETIVKNQQAIQDAFDKPIVAAYPDWVVEYKKATFNEAPYVRTRGVNYQFIEPQ
jgi:hypothetical protein